MVAKGRGVGFILSGSCADFFELQCRSGGNWSSSPAVVAGKTFALCLSLFLPQLVSIWRAGLKRVAGGGGVEEEAVEQSGEESAERGVF